MPIRLSAVGQFSLADALLPNALVSPTKKNASSQMRWSTYAGKLAAGMPKPDAHGQVHLAKVKGRKMVVKVQRPGLRELFAIDCKNFRVLAEWLQKCDPSSDGASRDWVAIYDECQKILYQVSIVSTCPCSSWSTVRERCPRAYFSGSVWPLC